jgi:two-component system, NarL family, nitrate/nitrite response regulator NarL
MNLSFQKQNRKIHVLIVASLTLVQESLQQLLAGSGNEITVIKSGNDKCSLINSVSFYQPDIILLYLMDGDRESINLIPELQKTAPNTKFIVLTAEKDSENQALAIELGAAGIVYKQQSASLLIKAIKQVHEGETRISQQLLAQLLKNNSSHKNVKSKYEEKTGIKSLSERETEVVMATARGLKNKEIAGDLSITEATVRHHLSSIYGKLFIADRLNLIIYAYQHGMIPEPINNQTKRREL